MVKAKQKRRGLASDGAYAIVMLIPYALLFSMFIAVPVAMAIFLSFTYFNLVQAPTFAGVANYIALLTQDATFFRHVLPNTLQFAILVGPGGFILSFFCAWMLAQLTKLPRTILALLLYMPSLASGVMNGVIWTTILSGNQNGTLNAWLLRFGLIEQPIQFLLSPEWLMTVMIGVSLWGSMGIGFLALLAGVLNVNDELYEAAYIDGIQNRFQEIIYITIPSLKPQMLFACVMAIVGAFNQGGIGVVLSGSNPTPAYAGQVITNHIEDFGNIRFEMGYAAAISVVLLGIIWTFSKLAHKFFGERD